MTWNTPNIEKPQTLAAQRFQKTALSDLNNNIFLFRSDKVVHLWKDRLKSMVSCDKKKRREAAYPNRSPATAGPIWKRGAAEWTRDEFCNEMKKLVASDMSLATSWKGRSKSIFHFLMLVRFFINFALPVFAQYAILPFLVFPSHTNLCLLHEHLIQAFLFVVDQSIHTCAHAE